jgi:O-antigen ligase
MTALRWACAVLIFGFPVTILVADEVGSTGFFLLALAGLIFPFFNKDRQPLSSEQKIIIYVLVFYFAVALLSYLFGDMNDPGLKRLVRYARLLLFMPIYFLLIRIRPHPSALWYGLNLGAIIVGLNAMNEVWWNIDTPDHGRASGSVNAILYGDVALVIGVMCLASIGYFWKSRHWLVILPISAALFGFSASFLSGSRGGWVAGPALLIMLGLIRDSLGKWLFRAIISITILASVIAYFIPQTGVERRITTAINETKLYFHDNTKFTSVGARLELWKAAWNIFKAHPILGAGVGTFVAAKKQLIEDGKILPYTKQFNQPHNDYFLALSSRGLLGITAFVLLLIVPFRIFRAASHSNNFSRQAAGLAGSVLVASFVCFSLTESIFDRALTITFYTFSLAVFLWIIHTTDATRKSKAGDAGQTKSE